MYQWKKMIMLAMRIQLCFLYRLFSISFLPLPSQRDLLTGKPCSQIVSTNTLDKYIIMGIFNLIRTLVKGRL